MSKLALFNPENFAPESTQNAKKQFQEGWVRVDQSAIKVINTAPANKDPQPVLAKVWDITRLNEDLEPLVDPSADEELRETLVYKMGKQALAIVHPANGSSPDDNSPERLGDTIGTSGNTFDVADGQTFQLHPKTGAAHLMNSLKKCGVPDTILNRGWCPDEVGCIFYMKSLVDGQMDNKFTKRDGTEVNEKVDITYKVVDKISGTMPRGAKKSSPAADLGTATISVLDKIKADLNEPVTKKTFKLRVNAAMQSLSTPPALRVPILNNLTDDTWLANNLEDNGLVYDGVNVSLATAVAV